MFFVKYMLPLLNIHMFMCFQFMKKVDVNVYLHVNNILDTGKCYKSITSVSYNDCLDIFESRKYMVNVMVYERRFLLCNLCHVVQTLKLKKSPGAVLAYIPSADTTLTNYAMGKPSSQSSTYERGDIKALSSLAVDGIWESDMFYQGDYMCAHTAFSNFGTKSEGEWWMVDLEHIYPISKIVMLNRADFAWSRLSNLSIRVGEDVDSMSLCDNYEGPGGQGENVTIICLKPLLGQFVKISNPGTDYLQLCEVAVYS